MSLEALQHAAEARGLTLRGAFWPEAADDAPEGTGTLILLGPDEPGFWAVFKASAEYSDGAADPLDRWSKRMMQDLATGFEGRAIFPSDGPPYPPFIRWSQRTGRAHVAPVGLLVHDAAGLFVSYRAALAVPDRWELPEAPASPCQTCETRPCERACPVGALAVGQDYDVPRCMAHITSGAGEACLDGCLVRRACPVSQSFGRLAEQSQFHMAAFLGRPFKERAT